MQATSSPSRRSPGAGVRILAAIVAIIGLLLGGGGSWLVALDGSPYYLVVGIAMLATGVLLWRGRASAVLLYAAVVLGTVIWAVAEIGFDWWPLVPRGDVVFVLGLVLLLPAVTRRLGGRWLATAGPLAAALAIAAVVGVVSLVNTVHDQPGTLPDARAPMPGASVAAGDDWPAYAGSWAGTKFSTLNQLTPATVGKLQVAWQVETGDRKGPGDPVETTYEVTPIKVGDTLYLCTPHDQVLALDAETGAKRWEFDPHTRVTKHLQHLTCRGVSWLDTTKQPGPPPADCAQRVMLATNDARLIALDPRTGAPCRSFGTNGEVSLLPGQPFYHGGWYQVTSAPLVARGLVMLGGAIYDDADVHMPSGVIRAFDGRTGKLVWNWDPGNPLGSTAPIGPNQHYIPSTPNMWTTAAADESLGLAYFPMGMGAVDQWGGHRTPATEQWASSVVALDIATGRPRWKYQTVHHDLWDMDIPAQPALVDLDLPGRGRVPALVQSTKTGNLFVLDRRTGRPLFATPERPVPQGAAPGDHLSPTQPFSAVNLMPQQATEAKMWGASPFDQLWCRIRFRSLDYHGPFTPPSLKGTLVFPGNFGVMDWGGLSIDPVRQVAFTHPNYIAFVDRLVPRPQSNNNGDEGGPAGGSDFHGAQEAGYNPNKGAPFAVDMNPFLSPLGLPCQSPPWGHVAGVDLHTGKVVWEHKNGTIRREAPVPVPITMGVPSLGGPVSTAGGVSFLSSAVDDTVRAYDTRTGRTLWHAYLPAGGQATPMTYRSAASGRQFVVVVAGGHGSLGTRIGDYVIAYALPKG